MELRRRGSSWVNVGNVSLTVRREGTQVFCCVSGTVLDAENTMGIFFLFFFFRATPAAYGSSEAGGRIRAAAEAYTTAIAMPDP